MLQAIKEFTKGPGILISTVMWEFFSVTGMRALLIFYLIQKLHFTDKSADQLYAAYISLIWVTPLIGGWLADRYLGFKYSVILGSVLIVLGHILMSANFTVALYVGLSLLICGIGCFKTNAVCLVASYYQQQQQKLPAMMTLYYVGANVGGTLAPILCAYLQLRYGYNIAFLAAAIGMAAGLVTVILGRNRFRGIGEMPAGMTLSLSTVLRLVSALVIAVLFFACVLAYQWVNSVIAIAIIFALGNVIRVVKPMSMQTKRQLIVLLGLTLVATFFWVLDQQGGSSISLFISRNINLDGIPAAAFQSINPLLIIVTGVGLATSLLFKRKTSSILQLTQKVSVGMLLLTLGYAAISLTAETAVTTGLAPMWGVVFGLAVMGVAELFIDPVVIAGISQCVPTSALGAISAVYYLFVGAIANAISGRVASLSAITPRQLQSHNLMTMAKVYAGLFSAITWVCLGVCLLLAVSIMLAILYRVKMNKMRRLCL